MLIIFEHECPFLVIDNVECSKGIESFNFNYQYVHQNTLCT